MNFDAVYFDSKNANSKILWIKRLSLYKSKDTSNKIQPKFSCLNFFLEVPPIFHLNLMA